MGGSACPGCGTVRKRDQCWGTSTTSVDTAATETSAVWTSVLTRPGSLTEDLSQCSLTITTMSSSPSGMMILVLSTPTYPPTTPPNRPTRQVGKKGTRITTRLWEMALI